MFVMRVQLAFKSNDRLLKNADYIQKFASKYHHCMSYIIQAKPLATNPSQGVTLNRDAIFHN